MTRPAWLAVAALALAGRSALASDTKRQRAMVDHRIMRVEERPDAVGEQLHDMQDQGLVEADPAPTAAPTPAPVANKQAVAAQGFPCHKPLRASALPEDATCSPQCPFWAESALVDEPCMFRCVRADECGVWGQGTLGNATVADPNGYCRRCFSAACLLCHTHEDRCVDCQEGYELTTDGKCVHVFSNIRYFTYTILSCFGVYVVCWYIELMLRPNVNDEGVRVGLAFRSRTKLRKGKTLAQALDAAVAAGAAGTPESEAAVAAGGGISADTAGQPLVEEPCTRPLWPLTTNLMAEPAGGPGTTLHFRFQCFWIVWAFVGCVVWLIVANSYNKDLLVLGLKEANSPRDLCRVVEWGHRTVHEAVGMKTGFCLFMYFFTFLGTILFAVRQVNYCQHLDAHTTMKDYAALLSGLPRLSGTVHVETELADFLRTETNLDVIGVSVCWDISEKVDVIKDMLEEDFEELRKPEPAENEGEAPTVGLVQERAISPMEAKGFRWRFFGFVDKVMLAVVGVPEDFEECKDPEAMVNQMETTPYAWVVFNSEQARDDAVELMNSREVVWNGSPLRMEKKEEEPESVRWCDFNVQPGEMPGRIIKGIFTIILCMLGWCLFFYMPYAFYMSTFQYDANHQEPSGIEFTILGFVVVGGNVTLYLICSLVAEGVGFHSEGSKESLYMVMYFVAVMVNVVLDVVVTGYISYLVMVGAGARTWGGKLLGEIDTVQELLEAYPIQKTLGYMMFAYSMPATFLIPFLVEPFALTFMPYHLMKKIVRSNPYLKTWRAERAMSIFAPMDSGRYADILINVTLAAMILYVPAGWIVYIYGGLFGSHLYIYLFDHYRVLRCVPGFMFPDETIDMFAWKLVSVPCAFILCCILAKANCQLESFGCVRGTKFYIMIVGAFFAHVIVHWLAIDVLVPAMRNRQHMRTDLKYKQVAQSTPATWFTTNPAYCLRSKYVYKHDPPVGLFVRGKEHMLRSSPEGGHFFEDKPAIPEKY